MRRPGTSRPGVFMAITKHCSRFALTGRHLRWTTRWRQFVSHLGCVYLDQNELPLAIEQLTSYTYCTDVAEGWMKLGRPNCGQVTWISPKRTSNSAGAATGRIRAIKWIGIGPISEAPIYGGHEQLQTWLSRKIQNTARSSQCGHCRPPDSLQPARCLQLYRNTSR